MVGNDTPALLDQSIARAPGTASWIATRRHSINRARNAPDNFIRLIRVPAHNEFGSIATINSSAIL
jgi:hypothetical protein